MLRRAMLAAGVALMVAAPASADPPGIALSWDRSVAARNCPSQEHVQQRVAEHLGYDPFRDGGEYSVEVSLANTDAGWYGRLAVHRADGTPLASREFVDDAPACTGLAEAVELALEFIIDSLPQSPTSLSPPVAPLAPAELGVSAAEATVASEAAAPQQQPTETSSAVNPTARPVNPTLPQGHRAVDIRIHLGATASSGILPDAALGVRGGVDLVVAHRLRPSFSAMLFVPVSTTQGLRTSFSFFLVALGSDLCGDALRTSRFSLSGCAGILTGLIQGSATSTTLDVEPSAPRGWFAFSASERFEARLFGPLWVEVAALQMIPLTVYSFSVGGQTVGVFQQQAVSFGGYLGLGLSL